MAALTGKAAPIQHCVRCRRHSIQNVSVSILKKLVGIFDRLCSLFMSKEKIELIHDYAVRSHRIFGQFIYGKFLDSLIIGIIAFIGLAILKVKFFPILAVFILITNMIPYFGPFIGGFPAVLVALMTGDLFHALAVLVFVFI